jgi:hypothetical protein
VTSTPPPAPGALAHAPLSALVLRVVYWLTPVFVALDFVYGISLRIPFLDALPGAKAAYYMVDVACAVAITVRPRWTAAVGYGESVVNISLLVLTTWVTYLGVLESAASPHVVIANPFTTQAVASLVLAASTLAASYVLNSFSVGPTQRSRLRLE